MEKLWIFQVHTIKMAGSIVFHFIVECDNLLSRCVITFNTFHINSRLSNRAWDGVAISSDKILRSLSFIGFQKRLSRLETMWIQVKLWHKTNPQISCCLNRLIMSTITWKYGLWWLPPRVNLWCDKKTTISFGFEMILQWLIGRDVEWFKIT